MRSENAMVTHQMHIRSWHERDQLFEKLHRRKENVSGSVRESSLKLINKISIMRPIEALECDSGSCDIADEMFKFLPIFSFD